MPTTGSVAASSHALDYDDTHFAHVGHPSVAILPAALAVAEEIENAATKIQTETLPEKEAACFRSGTGIAYRRAVVWTQLYSESAYRVAWCPIRRSPDQRLAGAFYCPATDAALVGQ